MTATNTTTGREQRYEAAKPATVFDLREVQGDEIEAAFDKLSKASDRVAVVTEYEAGVFDVYAVASGSKIYEVSRLGTFARCSCPDFTFSHSACKHIAACLPATSNTSSVEGFKVGDVFRITGVGYKITQVWQVVEVTEREITAVDRREMSRATNPDGWNRLYLKNADLAYYAQRGQIQRIEGEFSI